MASFSSVSSDVNTSMASIYDGQINTPVRTDSEDDEDVPEIIDETAPPDVPAIKPEKGAVGAKNIGKYGSFVYIINQIFGPGVLAIPVVFQQSGWLLTVITLCIFFLASSWSATLLCEAVRMIPGNHNYEQRYEYATTVRYYFGRVPYIFFQISMNICLQSLNIASIIVCAQSMDALIVFIFKKTFTLQFRPELGFFAGDATDFNNWYNVNGSFNITLGYVLIMILCIPMGMVNLDENIKFQWVSFAGLTVLMVDFIIFFLFESPFYVDQVPIVGHQFSQLVSVFIFAWAFVMLVPSWVNEKKDHVSVNKTIWIAGFISTIGYAGIGVLCALSLDRLDTDDVLGRLELKTQKMFIRVSAYLFSLFIIAPGIPVFCITTRYNLYIGGICGRKVAFFFGVIAPWIVGWIFTAGPLFTELLTWTALIFSGFVNFVLPFILYLRAIRMRRFGKFRPISVIGPGGINGDKMLVTPHPKEMEETPLLSTIGSRSRYDVSSYKKPFPRFMYKYITPVIIVMAVIMSILITTQIGVDLYYSIVK
eukprot:TRINITY_DN4442_c0_g1_i1.p1 TRINITY_DN4442_c0_g1~~TRINITY_DN4442_c0_g1_i1.p1  ORF type:complete len:536 (-),score=111.56 TRINITY_DN4442_c0_g1_i1:48-1655(-)